MEWIIDNPYKAWALSIPIVFIGTFIYVARHPEWRDEDDGVGTALLVSLCVCALWPLILAVAVVVLSLFRLGKAIWKEKGR